MAEIFWPYALAPSATEVRILDSTATFQSPLSGAVRTVSRPGTRWGVTYQFTNLAGTARARVLSIMAALRGRQNRIWLPLYEPLRGAFPATELLTNTALEATTGWTASGELSLYADSGALRATRTAVTSTQTVRHASVTLTNGAAYLMRAGALAGKGTMSAGLRVGSTAGANDYLTTTYTANGYWHVAGTIASTTGHPSVFDSNSGRSAGGFQSFTVPSLARCIRVDGASQTGSALNVKNLPTSTDGLLLPGDFVAVYTTGWEVKRVTAALNGDASGNGYLQFEPALRASPSDSAAIAVLTPLIRCVLAEDMAYSTAPGYFSDLTLSFVEDVT